MTAYCVKNETISVHEHHTIPETTSVDQYQTTFKKSTFQIIVNLLTFPSGTICLLIFYISLTIMFQLLCFMMQIILKLPLQRKSTVLQNRIAIACCFCYWFFSNNLFIFTYTCLQECFFVPMNILNVNNFDTTPRVFV